MPLRWSQLQTRGGQDVPSALQLGPSRSETSCLCHNACTPTCVHVGSTLSLMWAYKRKREANVYRRYRAHKGPQIPAHKQLFIITAFCRCTPCCFHKYRRTIHHGEWKETLRGFRFPAHSDTLLLGLWLWDCGDLELMIYDSSEMGKPAMHVETLRGENLW